GSGLREMNTSRPRFSRSMSPARSRSLRCLVTAFNVTSSGRATSVNRAGAAASCRMMSRREGCESAVNTSVSGSMKTSLPGSSGFTGVIADAGDRERELRLRLFQEVADDRDDLRLFRSEGEVAATGDHRELGPGDELESLDRVLEANEIVVS